MLILAPMEGVTDYLMRDLLSQRGGVDLCVTEFLRVTTQLYTKKLFYRWCPELHLGSRTRSGTPVFIQLLGGDPAALADNAARAAELGIAGIDLNFGCPAKTVNRHDGGATLLKTPERILKIVSSVRQSVPLSTPVTAKIRLGFDSESACLETSQAVQEGGASWLTVHCRTKMQGYRPPAHWEWIPRIQERVSLPLVANGDIASLESFMKCQEVSGADRFMIGRGALLDPSIFKRIKTHLSGSHPLESVNFSKDLAPLLPGFYRACAQHINEYFAIARTKQWMKQLSLSDAMAKEAFEQIKTFKKPYEFASALDKVLSHG